MGRLRSPRSWRAIPSTISLSVRHPANIQAHYDGTGAEIAHDLPGVTAFVAGLGTGGTLMGVGRRLKELNPEVKIVAAEPQQGEAVSGLRSLADGFVPPILDLDLLDSRMLVDSEAAFATTRELLEHEGIFAGVSSGAICPRGAPLGQPLGRGERGGAAAGWRLEVPQHRAVDQRV